MATMQARPNSTNTVALPSCNEPLAYGLPELLLGTGYCIPSNSFDASTNRINSAAQRSLAA